MPQISNKPEDFKPQFIQWARDWHGDHNSRSQHKNCSVYKELRKLDAGSGSFEALLSAVKEDDLNWEDSWELFVTRFKQENYDRLANAATNLILELRKVYGASIEWEEVLKLEELLGI